MRSFINKVKIMKEWETNLIKEIEKAKTPQATLELVKKEIEEIVKELYGNNFSNSRGAITAFKKRGIDVDEGDVL